MWHFVAPDLESVAPRIEADCTVYDHGIGFGPPSRHKTVWQAWSSGVIWMDDIVIARALHVVAVVIWIGGVSMAPTVALPAVRRGDLRPDRLKAFQAIERRFASQARTSVIVVGLSGLYMTWRLPADRMAASPGFKSQNELHRYFNDI